MYSLIIGLTKGSPSILTFSIPFFVCFKDAVLLLIPWILSLGLDPDDRKSSTGFLGGNRSGVSPYQWNPGRQHLGSFGKHGNSLFEFWFVE